MHRKVNTPNRYLADDVASALTKSEHQFSKVTHLCFTQTHNKNYDGCIDTW